MVFALSVYTPATPAKARGSGVLRDGTHHRPGAEADAEAEEGQVGQPVVGESAVAAFLMSSMLASGFSNWRGRPVALAEVPVVECEPGVPALGHGLGVACRPLAPSPR